jgi:DNA-binding FadR family transcriptional regulator
VAHAARNRLLEQFHNAIWGLLKEFAAQVIRVPGFKEYGLQLHTDVFDAIRNRNPQATQRCTKELMDYSDKIFRASASVADEHQIKR